MTGITALILSLGKAQLILLLIVHFAHACKLRKRNQDICRLKCKWFIEKVCGFTIVSVNENLTNYSFARIVASVQVNIF